MKVKEPHHLPSIPNKDDIGILFDNEIDRITFFEDLKQLLDPSRRKYSIRRSREIYSQVFLNVMLKLIWEIILEEMILYNKKWYLKNGTICIYVAKIPTSKRYSIWKARYPYCVFISSMIGVKHPKMKIKLRRKYARLLRLELMKGHKYSLGKIKYEEPWKA